MTFGWIHWANFYFHSLSCHALLQPSLSVTKGVQTSTEDQQVTQSTNKSFTITWWCLTVCYMKFTVCMNLFISLSIDNWYELVYYWLFVLIRSCTITYNKVHKKVRLTMLFILHWKLNRGAVCVHCYDMIRSNFRI